MPNSLFLLENNAVLRKSLTISVVLHALLLRVGVWSTPASQTAPIEVDISVLGPVGTGGAAPKPAAAPRPVHHTEKAREPLPAPQAVTHEEPASTAQEAAHASAASTDPPSGDVGVGTGDGRASSLSRIPQLLNLSDLNAILKKYYPEEAREARRQGTVILDLHIDADGHVSSADIVKSGGADFDAASQKVAALLRFSSAYLGSERVAVKMRQAIQFKLEQ